MMVWVRKRERCEEERGIQRERDEIKRSHTRKNMRKSSAYLFFCESDRSDLGLTKDSARDVEVVYFCCVVVERSLGLDESGEERREREGDGERE